MHPCLELSGIFRTFVWRWSRAESMSRGPPAGRDPATNPFSGSVSFPIGCRQRSLSLMGGSRDYAVFSPVSCALPVSESESLLDGV